jgi:hypothetical protein
MEVLTDDAASRLRLMKIGFPVQACRKKSSQCRQITPPRLERVSCDVMFTANWPTANSRVNKAG